MKLSLNTYIYIYIYEACELNEAIHNNKPCKVSLFFPRGVGWGFGMRLLFLGAIGELHKHHPQV